MVLCNVDNDYCNKNKLLYFMAWLPKGLQILTIFAKKSYTVNVWQGLKGAYEKS